MIFVLDVLRIFGLTFVLATVLIIIGIPVQFVTGRLVPNLPDTFGTYWLFGLGWISILCWYAFAMGTSPSWAYRFALVLGFGIILVRLIRTFKTSETVRDIAIRYATLWGSDVLAFLVCLISYLILSLSKIKHGSLPWLTTGNNDLLSYLKMGNYLLHFPNDLQSSGVKDLHEFATSDVFGAFNLISLGSFVSGIGVEHFAIPTMAIFVGSIGMAIARCCRVIFHLGAPLSILTAITLLTCPLFSYITLNYFLGQVLLVSTLLTTTLLMTEISEIVPMNIKMTTTLGVVSSITVMLCYPPWLLQYLVIISGVTAVVSMDRLELAVVRWAAAIALRATESIALLGVVLSGVSFTRVAAALTRLGVVSQANIAGWPLPFVNLDLLLGWPDDWRFHDPQVSVVGQSLAVFVLVVLEFAMLRRFDRGPGHHARVFLVVLFAAAGAAYLAIWSWFGASYQQWKFATTIPLAYGFVIPAVAVFLLLMKTSRTTRTLIRSGAACVFTVIVGLNVHQFYERWSVDVYDFPASLSSARLIDQTPEAARGYVKMDDYLARMGASVFVVNKPVTFSGPTYWGEGLPPPSNGLFVEVEAVCNGGLTTGTTYSAKRVTDGTLPRLPLDTTVPFVNNVDACFNLTGFSGREAFGRWTDGRHASIRFACACDLSRENPELDILAGTFLNAGTKAQTVLLQVNGSPEQRYDLVSMEPRHLVIKVPPGTDGSTVDIEIDMPDATAPTIPSSQEKRALGLSVVSLSLRQGT